MTDPHESEKYLVAWAKAKATDFKERVDRFFDDQANVARVVDLDPESREKHLKIRLTNPLPWELRGIASDAIKSLRDALDQCVLHSTERIGKPKGKGTHFPFGENPADFDSVLAGKSGRQSKDIAPELHDVLREFQPYPAGDGYTGGDDRLRRLGRVSGPNKHQLTLTVGIKPSGLKINRFRQKGMGGLKTPMPQWDSEKNEAVVLIFSGEGDVDFDCQFDVFVMFDDPWVGGAPAAFVLLQLADIVERIIARLEAETTKVIAARE